MNKKRSEWANEEGSALVLTLMIFLVLTVLATSISFLTVGSFRLSDINRDGTSAFYIAEAGAKKAYEEASQEVMKTYEATTTTTSSNFYATLDALFLNKERPFSFDKQFGDDAKANVTFTGSNSNPGKYTLTSTGSVGGKTRTVQKQFDVSWVDKGGSVGLPALPNNTALVTKGKTEIIGNSLTGDIYTASTGEGSFIIDTPSFNKTTIFYPKTIAKEKLFSYHSWYENRMPTLLPIPQEIDSPINWKGYYDLVNSFVVPTGISEKLPETTYTNSNGHSYKVIDKDGNLNVDSWEIDKYFQLDLTKDIKIPTINIKNGKTLEINPKGENRIITLDKLVIEDGGDTIEIVGEGRVTLVVKEALKINHKAIINSESNKDKLLLVFTGTNAKFNNMDNFYGNIIVKNKNAKIEVRGSNIDGIFMTDSEKKVDFKEYGTSQMQLIAPNADVEMDSYSIRGSIIANTFKLTNGAQLEYAKIVTTGFPVGSGGATSTPTLEDLIQSGPILEQ